MSLVGDIAQAYRSPKKVMKAQISRGITEAQTLFYGVLFGAMNLVAVFPSVAANAQSEEMIRYLMAQHFVSYIFIMPLVLYGFAAILHWVILKFGGQGTWAEARRALNWAAVVTIPVILMSGILNSFGNNNLKAILNVFIAMIFFWQLWSNFKQIEFT